MTVSHPPAVGRDALDVLGGGAAKVDGRDVRDGLPLGIQEHVEGDAALPQLRDVEQWADDVAPRRVIDQNLPVLRRRTGVRGQATPTTPRCGVQVEHALNGLQLPILQVHRRVCLTVERAHLWVPAAPRLELHFLDRVRGSPSR